MSRIILMATYSLGLQSFGKRKSAQKVLIKCWINWLQNEYYYEDDEDISPYHRRPYNSDKNHRQKKPTKIRPNRNKTKSGVNPIKIITIKPVLTITSPITTTISRPGIGLLLRKWPLKNDHLSTTAIILGFQGWSLKTGLIVQKNYLF